MASAMPYQLAVVVLLLLSTAVRAAVGSGGCASEKFPAGRSYASCADLPHLGAALHWTYVAETSVLSLAFVASPAGSGGWVAWGLNPTGDGMKGAQSLVAFKSAASSSFVVNTYNVTGYRPLGGNSTPIAFPATELAADAGSNGKIRMYGKLQLHGGMKVVNHIWQVGSTVTGGAPSKHAFAAENLAAKGKLVLAGGLAGSPAPAPVAGGPPGGGGKAGTSSSPAPSGAKSSSSSAAAGMTVPVLLVLAWVGFLATL